jgi:hypothetical protein
MTVTDWMKAAAFVLAKEDGLPGCAATRYM